MLTQAHPRLCCEPRPLIPPNPEKPSTASGDEEGEPTMTETIFRAVWYFEELCVQLRP